jgi:hypothetical protein
MISVHVSSILAPVGKEKTQVCTKTANLRVISIFLVPDTLARMPLPRHKKSEYGMSFESLYSNYYTFTTLIDRFTSLRLLRNSGYQRNQLIKFELLTQSIRQPKLPIRQ